MTRKPMTKTRKLEDVAATLEDLAIDLEEVTDGETTEGPQAKALDEAKVAVEEASDAVDESLLPQSSTRRRSKQEDAE
jgi:hypothetical protein